VIPNFLRPAVPTLALLVGVLMQAPAIAQPIKVPKPPPRADQGTALFRGLLHFYGVKPVVDVPERGSRETIVVILGHPQNLTPSPAKLVQSTLAAGGSVLIASETPMGLSSYFGEDTRFDIGGDVVCTVPENCLNGDPNLPLIRGRWNLEGFDTRTDWKIATYRPGSISLASVPDSVRGFSAKFPVGCRWGFRDLAINEVFAAGGAGGERQPYRCLVVADEKVFGNQMLYASAREFRGVTPDNFRFANEVVKWLTADGTRRECVFIENGQVQQALDEFDFTALPITPPKDVPFPPLPSPLDRKLQENVAKVIDEGLAKFEDDDRIAQALKRDNRFYGGLIAAAAILGLALALVLFARRVWNARHRPDFQPLPADPHLLGGEAATGSFEHRRLELMRSGDFRAPVVAYLRRMFESRGLGAGVSGAAMPPLEIRSRNRGELKAMIRELWEEAFVFDGDPLPYTRWKEIEQSLSAVKSAADGGLWEFRDRN
jgi:hypothetical protein